MFNRLHTLSVYLILVLHLGACRTIFCAGPGPGPAKSTAVGAHKQEIQKLLTELEALLIKHAERPSMDYWIPAYDKKYGQKNAEKDWYRVGEIKGALQKLDAGTAKIMNALIDEYHSLGKVESRVSSVNKNFLQEKQEFVRLVILVVKELLNTHVLSQEQKKMIDQNIAKINFLWTSLNQENKRGMSTSTTRKIIEEIVASKQISEAEKKQSKQGDIKDIEPYKLPLLKKPPVERQLGVDEQRRSDEHFAWFNKEIVRWNEYTDNFFGELNKSLHSIDALEALMSDFFDQTEGFITLPNKPKQMAFKEAIHVIKRHLSSHEFDQFKNRMLSYRLGMYESFLQ